MGKLTSQHVAAAKRLFEFAGAAALIMEEALPHLYAALRLGRGLLRRKMPDELKAQTLIEAWAYLSALLVSMVETWPARPGLSDLQAIIPALAGC